MSEAGYEFLAEYDAVIRKIDAEFDVRGSDLSTLVVTCIDNGGVVSNHRRKQFADSVPESVFAVIQTGVSAALAARHRSNEEADARDRTPESPVMSGEQDKAAEISFPPDAYEPDGYGTDTGRRPGDGRPNG